MARTVPGSTDAHALRMIAAGRIQYDPETGVILVDGQPRGVSDKTTGYNRVWCAGVYMPAHRVGWLCANGPIPPGLVINHRDGNRRNNRLDNLEAVTHQQNMAHAHRSPNYRGTIPGELREVRIPEPKRDVADDDIGALMWQRPRPNWRD